MQSRNQRGAREGIIQPSVETRTYVSKSADHLWVMQPFSRSSSLSGVAPQGPNSRGCVARVDVEASTGGGSPETLGDVVAPRSLWVCVGTREAPDARVIRRKKVIWKRAVVDVQEGGGRGGRRSSPSWSVAILASSAL